MYLSKYIYTLRHICNKLISTDISTCIGWPQVCTCKHETYLERLVVNALGANVVVAGIDQGHGLWEGRQL